MTALRIGHLQPARDLVATAPAADAQAGCIQLANADARAENRFLQQTIGHIVWESVGILARFASHHYRRPPHMLALATKVVSDYGRVLAQVQPGLQGMPESLLPHSRAQIRQAICTLLKHLEPEHTALRESLARGYVYLAQFVPDADAAALNPNASPGATPDLAGMRLMNKIKLDMERALEDLGALGIYSVPK
jgi:hypothetical protein